MDSTDTIRIPRTIREVYDNLPEGTLAQLINNQLVMSPAPTYSHQSLLGMLHLKLANHVQQNSLGQIILGPFDVHLDEENVFQPDLIFVSTDRSSRIQESGCFGAPDLVVEILSPTTAKYDLNKKKRQYERHGVLEYWILDPITREVQGFFLNDGRYRPSDMLTDTIESRVLGQQFDF